MDEYALVMLWTNRLTSHQCDKEHFGRIINYLFGFYMLSNLNDADASDVDFLINIAKLHAENNKSN